MSIGKDDDYVVSYRGEVVENRHKVHASVVDATGKQHFHVGDPSRITLARSVAKPAQALAILETSAFEQFDLDDADLALMCASHSSEERHITRGRNMLAKAQVKEDDLRCGGHPALSATRVFEEFLEAEDVRWSIDGCNLPAPAIPLHCLGRVYATLASSADQMEKNTSVPARTQELNRIFHAMTQYPELVGGDGRFCTVLMRAFQGGLVGKVGADGCYGIGIRASEQTAHLGATGAVGISLKIEDGNINILYSVIMEVFEQLQIRPPEPCSELADFHRPSVVNTAGIVTGRVIPAFKLRAALSSASHTSGNLP
ncbi:hypothetical protein LV164_008325 [Aspergillus fumigatus]|nr:hypothetical protein KXX42_001453 [Aspergillus fumigatus]KAH1551428.1 hypothetical protein KXX57_008634 [Aspergillus fumigatus]KAH1744594.1 hypothetical protein KXX09_008799 [Aspergillus fumigatus]KAH1978502.1 hypothetical protein KXW88_007779 [Aspergillus fumigatus]KAH2176148.1 hypothetical protein KXV74_005984 [Aspergillus fumigatus]